MPHRILGLAASVAAVLALSAAVQAGGREIGLDQYVGGAGACQSALPSFDGLIRKRPLAIQNEGDAPAFITCAPHQFVESDNFGIELEVLNNGAAAATVSCTVVGRNGTSAPEYITASVDLAAGARGTIRVTQFDGALDAYGLVRAMSCSLPPETGIAAIGIDGDGTVYEGGR